MTAPLLPESLCDRIYPAIESITENRGQLLRIYEERELSAVILLGTDDSSAYGFLVDNRSPIASRAHALLANASWNTALAIPLAICRTEPVLRCIALGVLAPGRGLAALSYYGEDGRQDRCQSWKLLHRREFAHLNGEAALEQELQDITELNILPVGAPRRLSQ
jgi:hypothetical protein